MIHYKNLRNNEWKIWLKSFVMTITKVKIRVNIEVYFYLPFSRLLNSSNHILHDTWETKVTKHIRFPPWLNVRPHFVKALTYVVLPQLSETWLVVKLCDKKKDGVYGFVASPVGWCCYDHASPVGSRVPFLESPENFLGPQCRWCQLAVAQSRTQSPRAFWPAGERPGRDSGIIDSIFPENVGSGLMTYGWV